MRYLDGHEAAARECSWCLALPGEGCRILQGNRASRVETFADGSPCGVHVARRVVWEPADMTRPCDSCGAQVDEPCRVDRGYRGYALAWRPHAIRLATSTLAPSLRGDVTHVRDEVHTGRSLCGVGVRTVGANTYYTPDGRRVSQPSCRTCRMIERHRARLAETVAARG